MTIEISELIIQATVTSEKGAYSSDKWSRLEEKEDDDRWVELISERVMQHLRDSGGWPI